MDRRNNHSYGIQEQLPRLIFLFDIIKGKILVLLGKTNQYFSLFETLLNFNKNKRFTKLRVNCWINMDIKHTPVIIGAAQFTQRKDTPQPLDSLSLMVKTGQKAIEDTHNKKIVDFIDAIYMVNISSWSYEDAPGELGKRLNITPKEKVYLPDGGQSPQMLVNRAAKAITIGEHGCVLITGGEAAYSIRKTFKGEPPEYWPKKENPK